MLEDEHTLYIYTDGSTFYNPRKTGIGIVFVITDDNGNEKTFELEPPGYNGSDIIQAEMLAIKMALEEVNNNPLFSKYKSVIIFTDSQFMVNYHKTAEVTWPKNKWRLSKGGPVANVDIWEGINRAKKKLNKILEIKKVKGHSKNIYNRKADKLARASAQYPINKSSQAVQLARKISKKKTIKGSVSINGQTMWIHIIERKYYKTQNIDRYRYEVMNKDSEYFENIDFIFSEQRLSRNHIYKVRVNKDQDFPKVINILQVINRRDWNENLDNT